MLRPKVWSNFLTITEAVSGGLKVWTRIRSLNLCRERLRSGRQNATNDEEVNKMRRQYKQRQTWIPSVREAARFENVQMCVFVRPKSTLLSFCLFFLCEASNCKVEWVQRGSLYCLFLCFSYARLQTVKWSELKKELYFHSFWIFRSLYSLQPHLRKTKESK